MGITFKVSNDANSTSFPNPNTLTVVDPFGGNNFPNGQVSQAWEAQGVKAFFPKSLRNSKSAHNQTEPSMFFSLNATDNANQTTVTVWYFDKTTRTWQKPKENPTQTYTGSIQDDVFMRADIPFYLEFSNPTSGTVSLSADISNVYVL